MRADSMMAIYFTVISCLFEKMLIIKHFALTFFIIFLFAFLPGHLDAVEVSEAAKRTGMNVPPIEDFGWGKTPGYIIMPIPIADPTIGNGLAVACLITTPSSKDDPSSKINTLTIGAAYTDTESWALGGSDDRFFLKDNLFLTTVLVQGSFNLKYYGSGNDSPLAKNPIDYSIQGTFFRPRLLWRIPDTSFFIGGQVSVSKLSTRLDQDEEEIPDEDLDNKTYGIGPVIQYDSRDNKFAARQGSFFEVSYEIFDRAYYDGVSYESFKSFYNYYFSLLENLTAGAQVNAEYADGDIPFYSLPYISLRGFPAGRYADDIAVSLQTEVRWQILPKWGTVFFVGAGRIGDSIDNLVDNETIVSYGMGIRYLASPDDKINLGVDFAIGPDDTAIYFRIGEAF